MGINLITNLAGVSIVVGQLFVLQVNAGEGKPTLCVLYYKVSEKVIDGLLSKLHQKVIQIGHGSEMVMLLYIYFQ